MPRIDPTDSGWNWDPIKPKSWKECPDCEGEGTEIDYETGGVIGLCEECDGAGGWEDDEDDKA